MKYSQAEQYLLSLANLPRREYMKDPKKCQVYLDRLQFFLNIIGNPEEKIPHYIHITGTSGKGSVCNFLHSILREAEKKVGSTISPHPTKLVERWRVGDKIMTKKELTEIVEFLKPKLDEYIRKSPYDMLSYFELTTVIALLFFARKKVEWAILEVGCGGRYDGTNVIPKKDIAIITNISLDHIEILGNTKEKIAYEKAGIIKKDCKVFTSEKNEKVLNILKKECKKQKAKFHILNSKFKIIKEELNKTKFEHQNETYSLSTTGKHQIKNAILSIEIARSLGINETHIKSGLQKTKQPLCLEMVSKKPTIILDSAHNPEKMKTTVKSINSDVTTKQYNDIHLVLGFCNNKNIRRMLQQLKTLHPKTIACTRNTLNPFRQVADPGELSKLCKKIMPSAKVEIFLDPKDAYSWSKKQMKNKDILLITGSIFLSGELRNLT